MGPHASLFFSTLAYPLIYTVPVSVIRRCLPSRVLAQQILRSVYVAFLYVVASPRLTHTKLADCVSLCSFADVIIYGVAPLLTLFTGSIYARFGSPPTSHARRPARRDWPSTLRDLVFSPVLEEFLFRGLLIRWLLLRGVESVPLLVFGSPVVFSLAHLQNIFTNVQLGVDVKTATKMCVVQSSYTYVFGVYATMVLLRTECVWVCVVAHSLANSFGFPDFRRIRPSIWVIHGIALMAFVFYSRSIYVSL